MSVRDLAGKGEYSSNVDQFKFFYRKDFRDHYITENDVQKGIAETTFMATGSKVISETNVEFRDLTDTVDVKEIVRIAKARKKDVDHTFQ